jgi:multimeric flavodoxin WrbA
VKIGFLYDSTDVESRTLYEALLGTAKTLTDRIETIDASAASVPPCVNCFQCWHKTPGVCVLPRDASNEFSDRFWDADFVVIVSRILWGGYATRVKLCVDRLLPITHPYFAMRNGEMHHRHRYGRIPLMLSAGYGARSAGEEATFRGISDANRDQGWKRRERETFIVHSGETVGERCDACRDWLTKEIAR